MKKWDFDVIAVSIVWFAIIGALIFIAESV